MYEVKFIKTKSSKFITKKTYEKILYFNFNESYVKVDNEQNESNSSFLSPTRVNIKKTSFKQISQLPISLISDSVYERSVQNAKSQFKIKFIKAKTLDRKLKYSSINKINKYYPDLLKKEIITIQIYRSTLNLGYITKMNIKILNNPNNPKSPNERFLSENLNNNGDLQWSENTVHRKFFI